MEEFFNYKPWHVLLKIKELLMVRLNCVLDPEYSFVVHTRMSGGTSSESWRFDDSQPNSSLKLLWTSHSRIGEQPFVFKGKHS